MPTPTDMLVSITARSLEIYADALKAGVPREQVEDGLRSTAKALREPNGSSNPADEIPPQIDPDQG
jgi:hypothetical protein